ncbi:MAG: fused MFS/spermidine synthase, partial [Smithellaceae bacterium]|nr:fused MFS/spermidine synthase [Smithellaceae bacterium]
MTRFFLFPLIYLSVFVTGSAGLIYQVTWQKYLQRLLGSDNIATAIILGVFLGGLSLGYYLCGILTTRIRNHLRAYAVLELIIGGWCLLFPVFFDQINALSASWGFHYPFWIIIQGMIASFILMGIPTICMGGTIPFLTRALTTHLAKATAVNSLVYAVNTAGAFAGALLAGFYLIPAYGLPLTIMGASLINILTFLFFYGISKYRNNFNLEDPPAADSHPPQPPPAAESDGHISVFALYATAFLSGFYVMTLENVFIRLAALSFGSSSYSFSLIISIFIFCIAVGSFFVSRLRVIRANYLFINQLAIALGLAAIYLGLDSMPYLAHLIRISFQSNMAGFWSYYLALFLILLTILFLPVSLMGATLPLIFHGLRRDMATLGKHAGYIFSCNTLGSLLGSLAGGVLLFSLFDIPAVYLVAVMLAALSALLLATRLGRNYLLPAGALLSLILIMLITSPFYDKSHFKLGTFRSTGVLDFSFAGPKVFFEKFSLGRMIFYRDGVTATVSVLEDNREDREGRKGKAIIVNGKSDSHTIGDTHTLKLLAHLPLLLSQRIEDVLIIGMGTGVTAGEATLYPEVKRIDVAEISPQVIEAQAHFRDFNRDLLKDSRVSIMLGDALRIMTRSEKKWDVIISEPSNPWTAGVDQLFTREFYRKAKGQLQENGLFLQWLHLYSADMKMLGMVFNTLQQEFPHIRVFFGNPKDLLILASSSPLGEENIRNAERVLAGNAKVRDSLQELNK